MPGVGVLAKPLGVTNLTAVGVSSSEIDVSWKFPLGPHVDGVRIGVSIDDVNFFNIQTLTPVQTSYKFTVNLMAGQLYHVGVVLFNGSGSGPQVETTATTQAPIIPDSDTFETYTPGPVLPNTWGQWDNSVGGHNTATVTTNTVPPLDSTGSNCLSQGLARVQGLWKQDPINFPTGIPYPPDVSVDVLTDCGGSGTAGTDGTGVFARLSTPGPTTANGYFAGGIANGGLGLFKIVNGVLVPLAPGIISGYVAAASTKKVILFCQANVIKAGLYIPSTKQFLTSGGLWQTTLTPIYAISVTDSTYSAGGFCGMFSTSGGSSNYDDFNVKSAATDITPPTCVLTSPDPTITTTWSGTVTITATAVDNPGGSGVQQVDFYIDGSTNPIKTIAAPGPYTFTYRSGLLPNGNHTIQAKATDIAQNVGSSAVATINETGSTYPTLPTFSQPLPNITLASSAYEGFPPQPPTGSLNPEDAAILQYFSVVDTGGASIEPAMRTAKPTGNYGTYTTAVDELAATSNQLDWLNWADANGHNREDAFQHVNVQTAFPATPLQLFPRVFWMQFNSVGFVNQIVANTANPPTFPASSGQYLYLGYSDKFRSVTLVGPVVAPSGGWTASWEYWNGTAWAALTALTDTTKVGGATLNQAGTMDFDPPIDWAANAVASAPAGAFTNVGAGNNVPFGSYKFFYVRVHVTGSGTAPTAADIQSADYTGQGTLTSGTPPTSGIPAYNFAQDAANVDGLGANKGWLTAHEYSLAIAADPTKTAHFASQSRAATAYGFGRFASWPNAASFQLWAVDYHRRYLLTIAGGDCNFISLDNMNCNFNNDPTKIVETAGSPIYATTTFIDDMASIAQGIWNQSVISRGANSWITPNLGNNFYSSGINKAAQFARTCPSVFLEDMFRPFNLPWPTFESELAAVAAVQTIIPTPLIGVDITDHGVAFPFATFATENAAMSDPAASMYLLCCYYMMKAPRMMLSMYGANSPNSSFIYHWSICSLIDLGADVDDPLGNATITPWHNGNDPDNAGYTYKIYKREFANAVVLYMPCSFLNSSTPGKWGGGLVTWTLNNLIAGNVASYYPILTPIPVIGTSLGNSGRVRITTSNNFGITDGQNVTVKLVQGTIEANGTFPCNLINSTHIDLVGTTWNPAHTFIASPGAQMVFCSQTPLSSITIGNGQGVILMKAPI